MVDVKPSKRVVKKGGCIVHCPGTAESPYGEETGDTDFEFLGVSGDIDFYLDPVRRVIVQISGKIDNLGKVSIRLKELEYAEQM